MVKEGCDYLVLETTSHGLDQNRVFGINYIVGVVTNVTDEHLDYHETYPKYLATKGKLLKNSKFSVLNKCAKSFKKLKKYAKGSLTYGLNCKAEINETHLSNINVKLPGDYNKENALAAVAAAKILDIDDQAIKKGVESVEFIQGRLNVLQEKHFKVIVDFAHTPNSLEQVLKEVKKTTDGDLIVVFGCAGLRDKYKRPAMGEIAGKLSSKIVVTAEDPRTEDLDDINNQIIEGINKTNKELDKDYFVIKDRKEAIDFAVNKLAGKGDTVIITGKGHEQSMCFGEEEFPWDDTKAVKSCLAGK